MCKEPRARTHKEGGFVFLQRVGLSRGSFSKGRKEGGGRGGGGKEERDRGDEVLYKY